MNANKKTNKFFGWNERDRETKEDPFTNQVKTRFDRLIIEIIEYCSENLRPMRLSLRYVA